MTTRRAPELYSFGNYYAASCCTHSRGPGSDFATAWQFLSRPQTNTSLFPREHHPGHKPPAEGITTAAIAFQHKSLSASPPCAGPSLPPTSPRPQGQPPGPKTQPRTQNPIHPPPGASEGPVGLRRRSSSEKPPAECHADSARLKNNTKGPRHAQCVVEKADTEYARDRADKRLEVCNIIGKV